jgi:hypothetical protein
MAVFVHICQKNKRYQIIEVFDHIDELLLCRKIECSLMIDVIILSSGPNSTPIPYGVEAFLFPLFLEGTIQVIRLAISR